MFKIMNKKIDLLLATNNLTWQNLANNINMEIETLNNKLNGTEEWDTIEAVKVAKYLNITLDELANNNSETLRLKTVTQK